MIVISARARRLCAVALLAACVLPASVASARGTPAPADSAQVGQRAAPAGQLISGAVRAIGTTTSPQTLTLALKGGGSATIDIVSGTKMLRLYKGPTTIADISVGDIVSVWGVPAMADPTALEARYVRDWSIQLAYTLMAGRVESAGNGMASVRIFWRMAKHSPFWRGELLPISVDSSASITSGPAAARASDAQPATVDDVQPGAFVWAWGLYDSATHTLRVRQLRIITAAQ